MARPIDVDFLFIAKCQTNPEAATADYELLQDVLYDRIVEQSESHDIVQAEITCAADLAQWAVKFAKLGDMYGLYVVASFSYDPSDHAACISVDYVKLDVEEGCEPHYTGLPFGIHLSNADMLVAVLFAAHERIAQYLSDLCEQGKIQRKEAQP